MIKDRFFGKIDNLTFRVTIQNGLIAILVITIVVESLIFFSAVKNHRVVIVPNFIDKQFYVEGDKASPEYIEMMGKYAVQTLTNYTPETVEKQFQDFLRFIHPSYYQTVYNELQPIIQESKRYLVYQSYVINTMSLQGDTLTVDGYMRRYVADKLIKSARMIYNVQFLIEGGKFYIVKLSYESKQI